MNKYIVENIKPKPYSVIYHDTLKSIDEYLNTDPYPEYRLVGFDISVATYTLIWELKDT